jgi:hypothetical protein
MDGIRTACGRLEKNLTTISGKKWDSVCCVSCFKTIKKHPQKRRTDGKG